MNHYFRLAEGGFGWIDGSPMTEVRIVIYRIIDSFPPDIKMKN